MTSRPDIRGVIVPLVSPVTDAGGIDESAVTRLIDHLLSSGVSGLFVLGTTGEASALNPSQRMQMLSASVKANDCRAILYAGVSMDSARKTIEAVRTAEGLGAGIAVAHAPMDGSVRGDACDRYFSDVADGSSLPLVLYNIPKTTGLSISLECIEKLAEHPNIVGIKDSQNSRPRLTSLLERLGGRKDFAVLVGCAGLSGYGLRQGAHGLVPSTANLNPRPYQAMFKAAQHGDWRQVERLQEQTNLLSESYQAGRSLNESLAQLKKLLSQRGLCGPAAVVPPGTTIGTSA